MIFTADRRQSLREAAGDPAAFVAQVSKALGMERADEQPRWTKRSTPEKLAIRLERPRFKLDLHVTAKSMDWTLYYGKAVYPAASGFGRVDAQKLISKVKAEIDRLAEDLEESAVGKTIVQQMGGEGAIHGMLGGEIFYLPKGVGIRWPSRQPSKGNYVEITLARGDYYDMVFYNAKGPRAYFHPETKMPRKVVKAFKGIMADQLIDLFYQQTGWQLHRPRVSVKRPVVLGKSGKVIDIRKALAARGVKL